MISALFARKPTSPRAAMMAAIRSAATGGLLFRDGSLADGLRVIRMFETVNGVSFDPTDAKHLRLVAGRGGAIATHRAVSLRLKRMSATARAQAAQWAARRPLAA